VLEFAKCSAEIEIFPLLGLPSRPRPRLFPDISRRPKSKCFAKKIALIRLIFEALAAGTVAGGNVDERAAWWRLISGDSEETQLSIL
jgi:hypothetical protein